MSFLDDLKKEAEQAKARQQEASSTTQRRRDRVLQNVRPRMQALYKYLKDAFEQLCVVDPDAHMSYDIRGFGKLGPLRQSNYKVTADDPRNLDKFTVSYACSGPDQVQFQIDGKDTALKHKEYLWSCNLRFTSKMTADGSSVFFLDAYVPVTFEFEADFESGRVTMRSRNVEVLGTTKTEFDADQLDSDFMDELVKCIVRKPNRFQDLSGNMVSEESRMRLRQQLAMDQYKRQVEAASGSVVPEPAGAKADGATRPAAKKKGLLRSLFRA
jgi:hypothetical protein